MVKNPRLLSIKKILQKQLEIPYGATVVVGVSGGADSTALLHLLSQSQLELNLIAVYIDHGLRPSETPAEIAHVQKLAQITGARFICRPVDVQKLASQEKRCTEDAARILRYQVFEGILEQHGGSYIAVAHNADDQVEEFFLRVLRGTGRKGLCGMPKKHKHLIRPLLDFNKKEILTYLQKHNIHYCEDSSNFEQVYLRNKIRLDVLPYLERHNPSLRKSVLNISEILSEEEDYLSQAAHHVFLDCVSHLKDGTTTLDCQLFLGQHRALQKRVIEALFWQLGNIPSFESIAAVLDLAQGRNGRGRRFASNLLISKRDGKIIFFVEDNLPAGADEILATIESPGEYLFPALSKQLSISTTGQRVPEPARQLKVDAATIHFPLTIRYHLDGEKFLPFGAPGKKKVSRFLTDRKIHREEKKKHPVLCHKINGDEQIIAVLGVEVGDQCKITDDTQETLLIRWQDMD